MLTARFYKMDLADNEVHMDMFNYLYRDGRFIDSWDVTLKENTSLKSPTLVIDSYQAPYKLDRANYCELLITPNEFEEEGYVRRYFVEDVVTITVNMCEVRLRFDPFRTFEWWESDETKVRLGYTSEYLYWSKSCDDPRWQPMSAYGPYMGVYTRWVPTGLRAAHIRPKVGDASYANPVIGCYLVKFWWGFEEGSQSKLGIVYAMFDETNFRKFIYEVNHYITEHWGSTLSGIQDFTKFIIWAKYIPDLVIDDDRGDGIASQAGYSHIDEIGVGGLCRITGIDAWIKRDRAGYIQLDHDPKTSAPMRFPLRVISGNASPNNYAPSKDMQFLLSSKWASLRVETQVGVGTIPLENLQDIDYIQQETLLDLESCCLNYYFYRYDTGGGRDVLLSLSGNIGQDVTGAFTHIQSAGEVMLNTAVNGAANAAASFLGGAVNGAANNQPEWTAKSLSYGRAVNAAGYQQMNQAGIQAGSASVISNTASIPFQMVGDLTKPRVVNQPMSTYNNDLNFLHLFENTLGAIRITSVVYMNPDTPVWDPNGYREENSWNGSKLWENYCNWCREKFHGYPSNKYIRGQQLLMDSKGLGYHYFKCSDVLKVSSNKLLGMLPEDEADIRQHLLAGVTLYVP